MKKVIEAFKNFWGKGKLSKFIVIVVCLVIVFGVKSLISNIGESIEKSEEHSQEYTWPDNELTKLLPEPETKTGIIQYDREDLFEIILYDSSREEFDDYVSKCKEKGFTKEHDLYESDSSVMYDALNSSNKNYDLRVEFYKEDGYYDENSIMISLQNKEKQNNENNSSKNNNTTTENNDNKNETNDSSKIDPDFKKAMDSYEDFFDEYIAFMEKYKENPSDAELLKSYADYVEKYTKYMNDLENMKTDDLNDAELKYYTDVHLRITQKLFDAGIE